MDTPNATISDQNQEAQENLASQNKECSSALFASVSDQICGKGKHAGDHAAANPTAKVKDHGQINSMDLPAGWNLKPSEGNPGIGTRSYQEASPKNNPDVSLSFFYRGLPVPAQDGTNFKNVLEQKPHELSADELRSLSNVLSQKTPLDSDQFKLRTEELNGKNVLVVEGSYPASRDAAAQQIHELYVNASGDGRAVQEIFYQAPADAYGKYSDQALNALKSIKWK